MSYDFFVDAISEDMMRMFARGEESIVGSHQAGGSGLSIRLDNPQSSVDIDTDNGVIHLKVTPCHVRSNAGNRHIGLAFVSGDCKIGEPSVLRMSTRF